MVTFLTGKFIYLKVEKVLFLQCQTKFFIRILFIRIRNKHLNSTVRTKADKNIISSFPKSNYFSGNSENIKGSKKIVP